MVTGQISPTQHVLADSSPDAHEVGERGTDCPLIEQSGRSSEGIGPLHRENSLSVVRMRSRAGRIWMSGFLHSAGPTSVSVRGTCLVHAGRTPDGFNTVGLLAATVARPRPHRAADGNAPIAAGAGRASASGRARPGGTSDGSQTWWGSKRPAPGASGAGQRPGSFANAPEKWTATPG